MHDVPYLRGEVGPEIVADMTAIAIEVKGEVSSRNNTQVDDRHGPLTTNHGLPVGNQILAGANNEAMAVPHAAGHDFIRAEGYVYAHVADDGLIQASAANLLRFRKIIGANK